MSIYDHVWLGPNVYLEPDFLFESVVVKVFHRRSSVHPWEEAYAQDGGRGDVVVPLRVWEEIQVRADGRGLSMGS